MTRTVAPLGSGVGDQAMYASEPPRTLTITSPGPAGPLVATLSTPMLPMSEVLPSHRQPPLMPPGLVQGLDAHSMPPAAAPMAETALVNGAGGPELGLEFIDLPGPLAEFLVGRPLAVVPTIQRVGRGQRNSPARVRCS